MTIPEIAKRMPIARLTWFVFAVVGIYAMLSVPALGLEQLLGVGGAVPIVAASVLAAGAVVLVIRYRDTIKLAANQVCKRVNSIPPIWWVLGAIILGLVLRIGWVLLYPAEPASDSTTYLGLARNLYETGIYSTAGTRSFWPPGYPFFLYANFLVLGIKPWVPIVANFVLFGATVAVVYLLGKEVAEEKAARIAVVLVSVWPSYLMSAGIARKEGLIILLIPMVLLLYFWARERRDIVSKTLLTMLAGASLGFACLTQPSLLLLPIVLVMHGILYRDRPLSLAMSALALMLGMAMVITPWTLRNHRVLDEVVLVSNNGGDVLYRANNPLATGGYTARGERDLKGYDEVTASRLGRRWAREWIAENPGAFLRLALRKQMLFLGDDSSGAFETLRRGSHIGGVRYIGFKGISNLFWWTIWFLILLGIVTQFTRPELNVADFALLMWVFLYLFAMHSVFESGGRHHLGLIGPLAILAAALNCTAFDNGREPHT